PQVQLPFDPRTAQGSPGGHADGRQRWRVHHDSVSVAPRAHSASSPGRTLAVSFLTETAVSYEFPLARGLLAPLPSHTESLGDRRGLNANFAPARNTYGTFLRRSFYSGKNPRHVHCAGTLPEGEWNAGHGLSRG